MLELDFVGEQPRAGRGDRNLERDAAMSRALVDQTLAHDDDVGDIDRRFVQLEATGLDVEAIWEWGVVERLSTALLAIEIDLQPEGSQLLAAAERLAGATP